MPVFISHVEENADTAEAIGRGLRDNGYEPWTYESDTLPGPTYLSQVVDAIEHASALILIISPASLGSHQVAREIEVAHELDRPIIPVLKGISHEKFVQRRPEWRLALGAYTSIAVPAGGVGPIIPKIVGGLQALGVGPDQAASGGGPPPPPPPAASPQGVLDRARTRPWNLVVVALIALVVVGIVAALVATSGGDDGEVATDATDAPAGEDAPASGDEPAASGSAGQLEGAVEVEPTTVGAGDEITVTYSITNTSDEAIEAATTELTVLIGADPLVTGVVLADISADIAPGATIEDSFATTEHGVEFGDQTVAITQGRRVPGGTTDVQVVAEAPITIEG